MLYPISTIIDNGTWTTTKPVIKEMPVVPPHQLLNFRRVIIILKKFEKLNEDTIGRSREGRRSVDVYDITIRASNMTDLDNLIDNFREILIDAIKNHTTTSYTDIRYELGDIKSIIGSVYEVMFKVTGYKIGQVF